jgi:pyruvate kinase
MRTKILCTLGPASLDADVIRQLDERGVSLFRLNLSHTPVDQVAPLIAFIREHTSKPICLDTDGDQVRCGVVEDGVRVLEGHEIRLTPEPIIGTADHLTLRPGAVFDALRPGDELGIDINGVVVRIVEASSSQATAVVLDGGPICSNRAVTIDHDPHLPSLTDGDLEAIRIGRDLGVRHFALSFARSRKDVARLGRLGGLGSFIISKIESRAGVRNMNGIIEASDAVLVDRGDLSREIPLEYVPMYQKEIIRRANSASTPAFVATNLLESMIVNRRPTIAEANDIINTLLDGAHGLVLASETTIGRNPVASVEMVARLIDAFEWSRGRRLVLKSPRRKPFPGKEGGPGDNSRVPTHLFS